MLCPDCFQSRELRCPTGCLFAICPILALLLRHVRNVYLQLFSAIGAHLAITFMFSALVSIYPRYLYNKSSVGAMHLAENFLFFLN